MKIKINIENANKISALKAGLKTKPKIKFKIKQDCNGEYLNLIKDYEIGKIKSYSNSKEMHEDIIN